MIISTMHHRTSMRCSRGYGIQLKLPQIQKIMMEFEKQSQMMDMKQEVIEDTLDDAFADEDDEEETYAIFGCCNCRLG